MPRSSNDPGNPFLGGRLKPSDFQPKTDDDSSSDITMSDVMSAQQGRDYMLDDKPKPFKIDPYMMVDLPTEVRMRSQETTEKNYNTVRSETSWISRELSSVASALNSATKSNFMENIYNPFLMLQRKLQEHQPNVWQLTGGTHIKPEHLRQLKNGYIEMSVQIEELEKEIQLKASTLGVELPPKETTPVVPQKSGWGFFPGRSLQLTKEEETFKSIISKIYQVIADLKRYKDAYDLANEGEKDGADAKAVLQNFLFRSNNAIGALKTKPVMDKRLTIKDKDKTLRINNAVAMLRTGHGIMQDEATRLNVVVEGPIPKRPKPGSSSMSF